jgi:multimeric flavodoxin WrbA
MKVIAFNSSPKMDKGNTALILNPFLRGMEEAGAEVELFFTKKLKVKPCQGELNCWFKTPGKCFQKDDMLMINEKLAQADVIVYATPLYVDGFNGPMKNLIDRMVLRVEPTMELRNGKCRHPKRPGAKISKVVLVSNCGFWEINNFDHLVTHVKEICDMRSQVYAGALLRPHGPVLRVLKERGEPVEDILDAAAEAGRQLIREGKMSIETLNTVSRELFPLEMYINAVNERAKRMQNSYQ